MFRGQARRSARTRWVRRALAAGVIIGGAIAVTSGGAGAQDCLVVPFGPCPGTGPIPTTTTSTTSTTVVTAPTTTAPPRPTPAPSPGMTAEQAADRLLALVNGERSARGLPTLAARKDVTGIAMRWSAAMAQRGELKHNDAYFSRETRRKLDARVLGENVARAADVESAHRALMASEHHRDNLLDKRFTVAGFGAQLTQGSWWFTQNFVEPVPRRALAGKPASGAPGQSQRGLVREVRAHEKNGVAHTPVVPTSTDAATADGATSLHVPPADGQRRGREDRPRSDQRQTAAVALLAAVVVGALVLRRWAVQKVLRAKRAHTSVDALEPVAPLESCSSPLVDDSASGCRHQLAIISSWTRTLEDRWMTMSTDDKRIAMQVIERSAEEALADMALA